MRRHNAGLRLTPEKQLQEGDYIESLKVELPPGQVFVTEIGWWMVVVVVVAFFRKISFSFKLPLFIKALVHKGIFNTCGMCCSTQYSTRSFVESGLHRERLSLIKLTISNTFLIRNAGKDALWKSSWWERRSLASSVSEVRGLFVFWPLRTTPISGAWSSKICSCLSPSTLSWFRPASLAQTITMNVSPRPWTIGFVKRGNFVLENPWVLDRKCSVNALTNGIRRMAFWRLLCGRALPCWRRCGGTGCRDMPGCCFQITLFEVQNCTGKACTKEIQLKRYTERSQRPTRI